MMTLFTDGPRQYRTGQLRLSRRVHGLTFLLPALLLATLVNMPKFLETELVTRNITNQGTILETFNKG